MKKSKLIIGFSAALLAIGGFTANKVMANHKAVSFKAYIQTISNGFHTVFSGASVSNLTTVSTGGAKATIKTAGGVQKTLFATNATSKPLYLK